MLMDTEREADIGIGQDYPFGKLEAGECIISQGIADLNEVAVGDQLTDVAINLYNLTRTQSVYFNEFVKDPDMKPVVP